MNKNQFDWKIDDFDSEVFNFKVAKIISCPIQSVDDLTKDLRRNEIKYAVYRVKANNFSLIHSLQKSGFLIVDGMMTLEKTLTDKKEIVEENIREGDEEDLGQLKEMTSGLYLLSRVYNDPLISKEKANEFFIKWVVNSVKKIAADSTLVWEETGKILGYITLQKRGQISLIGVSRQYQGHGIAKKMLSASFNRFIDWGVERVIIETQMYNFAALHADQDLGFKITDSYLTFRWAL